MPPDTDRLRISQPESLIGIDKVNWKFKRSEKYLDAIKKIQSYGVTVNGCFIVGNDGDDKGIFEELRNFIEKSELLEAQVTILTPFPEHTCSSGSSRRTVFCMIESGTSAPFSTLFLSPRI